MKISRRIKASRANGAKSKGPKTPEGKLRSQTHAIRHGMLARCVVLEGEDPDTFLLLMSELEERFAPVDEVELGFIEEMGAAYWRMRRGWTIEAELLNEGLHSQRPGNYNTRLAAAFTGPDLLPKLGLLQRYESRLHRMYQRAMNNLIALRAYRPSLESSEQPNPESEHPPEPQVEAQEPLAKVPQKHVKFPAIARTSPQPPQTHPHAAEPPLRPPAPGENPAA